MTFTTETRVTQSQHEQAVYEACPRELLVVSYGLGLDSTAMLVEMRNRGMRPDLILFADTGAEKPETYAYLPIMQAWLRSVGFPEITVVRFAPTHATYRTLEGKCLTNETMPSLAYGKHSCALVFKVEVQVKYLRKHAAVRGLLAAGGRVVKCIGYDDSEADRNRRAKADRAVAKKRLVIADKINCGQKPGADLWESQNCDYRYLLQDWNLERTQLAEIIVAAGLPVPCKSACFFCPASQPEEVVQLRLDHPELYARAVAIESLEHTGKHAVKRLAAGETIKHGLGMGNWAWSALANCSDPSQARATLRAAGFKVSKTAVLRP
jgi:hypothetical protein